MGKQIVIKAADMAAAGWVATHTVQQGRVVADDHTGDPVVITGDAWTTWTHTCGASIRAYHKTDFVADCRGGGENEAVFRHLGLLDLPHTRW
ncbi:MAG: hypothetical protein PHN51_10350 [Candidatus Nanopelagicales bacterium]|nr:hypothetical protein [Candidatus Nanopelagicales bacterium]